MAIAVEGNKGYPEEITPLHIQVIIMRAAKRDIAVTLLCIKMRAALCFRSISSNAIVAMKIPATSPRLLDLTVKQSTPRRRISPKLRAFSCSSFDTT